jgi:spore coat polysaccharide biosynthesis protein SpsF
VLVPAGDDVMSAAAKDVGCEVYDDTGDEGDVMGRFCRAIEHYGARACVRLTADCPCIHPEVIQKCIEGLTDADYVSNTIQRTYPEGWDVQGATKEAWEWLSYAEKNREHPFSEFDQNLLLRERFVATGYDFKHILNANNMILKKWSIDTQQELEDMERKRNKERLWLTI